MKFDKLAREYATLWDNMEITRLHRSIERTADRIIENRARYEVIEASTGVPWFVVGIIHSLETGLRFDRHLHNGDPLTAKTKLVPAGRPLGHAPFTFEQSCQDALCMKAYDKISAWPIERIAWALENYNGWGYRKYRKILSPYLWSGSNHYRAGKYVADGKWSSTAVSTQSGGMPLLKAIADKCPDVQIVSMFGATPDPEQPSPASNASASEPVVSPGAAAVGGTGIIGGGALLADPAGVTSTAVAVKSNAGQLLSGVDLVTWGVPLIIGVAVLAFLYWSRKNG